VSDPHAFAWGIDLFDHGYFWEAHEAWEPLWRAAAGEERALLHGLVQCAAVCLKLREGRRDAARRLATRALAHVDDARGAPRFGLDVDELAQAFAAWSRALAIDDRPHLASRCAR
jgi:predicted metal-dependent hydrolase